jgi:cell wall-associated NlpC family hydrolase
VGTGRSQKPESSYPGILLPTWLLEVRYNGKAIPGDGRRDLSQGANCQLFAYALLAANGIDVPDFRSSELWSDDTATQVVSKLAPLDLLLFNSRHEAYGAHVAVCLGGGEVIHLAKRERLPRIWPLERFAQDSRYSVLIGAKRVIRR